jgi:hypothetical protein
LVLLLKEVPKKRERKKNCHSRANGNPEKFSWIPAYARLAEAMAKRAGMTLTLRLRKFSSRSRIKSAQDFLRLALNTKYKLSLNKKIPNCSGFFCVEFI